MRVYLDNNATTAVDARVLEVMEAFCRNYFGNPSSLHSFGQEARAHVDAARRKIAELMGVEESEIVFTGSGSESDNAAIRGVLAASGEKRPHVVTSEIEHPAVFNTVKDLQTNGVSATFVPVGKNGAVDPDEVRRAITERTVVVSIQHVNNESGVIQPIEEIARICAEREIYFHTDAVQSVGRIPVNLAADGIDLASVAAHKFNGPKGVGFLYAKTGTRLRPFVTGGGQEEGRRAGTQNTPAIVGMARAMELAIVELPETMKRVGRLRDRFEKAMLAKVRESIVNGGKRRVPNTSNIRFAGIESEAMLLKLDMEGIAASAGSACSTGSASASHVLIAMGLAVREASSSVRFSLGKFTTDEEIEYAVEVVPRVVEHLREVAARA